MLKIRAYIVFALAALLTLCPGVSEGSVDPVPSPVRVTSLHQWVVDRMETWSPPGITYVKEAKETPEEGRARYELIAEAAISVVYDPSERPIFQGKHGRAMTLALLTSIAFEESAFRKDVDYGIGPLSKGDSGRSWCMAQVMMGRADPDGMTRTRVIVGENGGLKFVNDPSKRTGWGGEDLVQDRTKCFRVALRLARMSFASCSSLPVKDRLSMYASGSCSSGSQASRRRVGQAQRWLWRNAPPLEDSEVTDLLHGLPPEESGREHAVLRRDLSSGIVLI
jgi:hypothetical protein